MSVLIGSLSIVVLAVGLLSFEIGRANLASQQLQNVTDAAVLACAATLASEDNTNPTTAHSNAVTAALTLFQQNAIMGYSLASAQIVTAPNNVPPPGQADLYFQFIDPITQQVVPSSSPTGKIVRLFTDFGVQPAFGGILGVGAFAVHSVSNSAVPQLDIVVCFDISGSMDDQTPVTLVKREWDSTLPSRRQPPAGYPDGKILYDTPPLPSLYGTNGILSTIMQPGPSGSSLNGIPPEYLSFANDTDGMWFSIPISASFGVPDLHSDSIYPDAGVPPGNYKAGAFTWPGWSVFTDMVVNIDNQTTFGGTTSGGYSFPDIATLVEAARGNLDTTAYFHSSLAYSSVAPSVNPQAGYQAQYFKAATQVLQPISDAKTACSTFLNIINSDTDAHFGFIAFDSTVGTSPTDTETVYNIDEDCFIGMPKFGVLTAFPRPMVPLDPTPGNSNYTAATTALTSCVPIGATNIGAAINAAVTQLTTNQRTGAVRAIVLFTDGEPDTGGPLNADPLMNARAAAVLASNAGIPVYTIGLAHDPAIQTDEIAILNDTNSSPTSGGVAAISGHGATFNQVTTSSQLTAAFENVARCLVQLVSNGAT